jgi:hypothetical protein
MRAAIVMFFFLAFTLLLTISCMNTSVKRFKTAEFMYINDSISDSLIEVNLFGVRVEPVQITNKSDILLLGDLGQSEFIKILDNRYKDNDQYIDALKGEYFNLNEPYSVVDYSIKDLKMVFSISKKLDYENMGKKETFFSPADRIENLRFSLKLDPSTRLKYTKWNRYTTQFDTINIADMTFSKSLGTKGSVNNVFSGSTTQISSNTEQSMQEKQNILHRYILLSGSIDDSTITIEEEGVRDIDLAGNVIADVSVKFPEKPLRVVTISNLKNTITDKYLSWTDLKIKFDIVNIPDFNNILPDTVMAFLSYEYIYRHVISGYDTYYEWDDKVAYFKGKNKKNIVLFNKDDYLPHFYYIGLAGDDEYSRNSGIIVNDILANQYYMLVFKQYWEARDFFKWLNNFPPDKNRSNRKILLDSNYILMKGTPDSRTELSREMIRSLKLGIYKLSHLTRLYPLD